MGTAALLHGGDTQKPRLRKPPTPAFPLFTPLNRAPSVLLAEVSTGHTRKADQRG